MPVTISPILKKFGEEHKTVVAAESSYLDKSGERVAIFAIMELSINKKD